MFIAAAYRFLYYLRFAKDSSEHTIRNYCIDLNALKNFIESKVLKIPEEDYAEKIRYNLSYEERDILADEYLDLKDIDRRTLRRFVIEMTQKNTKKKTVVRRLSSLRSFFKYLVRQNLIDETPMADIESPKLEKKLPYFLSYAELQTFFDTPNISTYLGFRDRVIMELFYSSGLRVSELTNLNRTDFDFDNLLLHVRGKGKKERLLPITKNAADWIKRYLLHPERFQATDGHLEELNDKAIFLNKFGTRLTPRSVDRKFDKYLTKSGLAGKVTPHTIRHTIATHWLENGMNLKTIQLLLGHTSPVTTTIYTQVSTKLQKEVYDQAHPRA